MNGNNRSLQAEPHRRPHQVSHRPHQVGTRQTPAPPTRIIRTAHILPVDADLGRVGNALSARIKATKKRLLAGGVMQPVEWGIPGEPDVRGRIVFTYFMLDAVIEQRPGLERDSATTDRSDNTVLTILDPVAITDDHTFRWGDPVHVHKIKAVEGLLQNEETGIRFASEVTVIR